MQLEFELAYYDVAVQYVSHFPMQTTPNLPEPMSQSDVLQTRWWNQIAS